VTDNLKESLSALIDGEASELEVHRLLRQFGADETLRPSWMSYLHVRTVVRGESVLSREQHLALHEKISTALEDEETYAHAPASSAQRFYRPAGMAIAASVLVAVVAVFTFNSTQVEDPGQVTADTAAGTIAPAPTARPVDGQLVSTGPEELPQIDELKELSEEQQRQLRAYLNRHDRSRLNPNVRTVIYDESKGN
jgi:sigma-E factor negative regulatory protein RseA